MSIPFYSLQGAFISEHESDLLQQVERLEDPNQSLRNGLQDVLMQLEQHKGAQPNDEGVGLNFALGESSGKNDIEED